MPFKGETNMAFPFEPLTTKKLREFLKGYLEENCKSQETNQHYEKASHLKNRNKLMILSQVLETWRQRQLES